MTSLHKNLTEAENHRAFALGPYANAAARTGAGGFISDDLWKLARQEDDNSIWMLTATTPTWIQIGASAATTVTATSVIADNALVRGDGGARGAQSSDIAVSDNNNVTALKTASFYSEYSNGNSTATFTWSLDEGQQQSVTLNATSVALTVDASNVGPGRYMLRVIQDGSGSRAITSGAISGGTVYTPDNGTAPSFSSGSTDVDLMWCYYDGTNVYLGIAAADLAAWT